jgi:tol-pal system protein YbgF
VTSSRVRVSLRISLFALTAASACVASKGDIRVLQDEMRSLRSSIARSDTLQRMKTDSAMMLVARVNDSLRALSTRVNNFQGSVSGELFEIGRQLLTIQELTGQSQRRLQELRAEWEQTRSQAVTAPAATPGDTAHGSAPAQPQGPGPYQLYMLALGQLRQGSYGAARQGFQDLLTQYPTFEDAPAAMTYIGESFARERNEAAADSVYQLVVTKYPQSAQAPNALYKRALLLKGAGKEQEARVLLQRIVKEYPRSDEASLAGDLLATPVKK